MRALIALALALTGAYAVRAIGHYGGETLDAFFVQWIYDGVAVIGMVLCIWRAVRIREGRAVWSLIALGFSFQVAGNEVYTALYGYDVAPSRRSRMRCGSPATCR